MGGKSARENNPKFLLKLLQICFERFRSVVSAHGVLLSHLQRSKRVYNRRGGGEGLERRGGEGTGGKGRERVREIKQGRCGSEGGGGEKGGEVNAWTEKLLLWVVPVHMVRVLHRSQLVNYIRHLAASDIS